MPLFFYTLAIYALLPWALLHLLWRARRQPDYLRHWPERFGFFGTPPTCDLIWIHAVSVGETRAAQPLVKALRARYPDHRILLTHMTPTGRATSTEIFGDTVTRVYLPYDTPGAMRRFLRHFRPKVGLIMETELWPNLIAACRAADIPLLLVNARLSEKSARRYARFPALTRNALCDLTAITAIGADDARRLRELGAPDVAINGNMKFDIEPPTVQLELGQTLRARIGTRPVFLCASTREGEEALLLDAWAEKMPKVPPSASNQSGCANVQADDHRRVVDADETLSPLLILVPRHPQRFDAVAELVAARGFSLQRRSDEQPVAATTQVWLGDSMGEMFAWYVAADVALVGGSLREFGSQNLIEPCAVGTPVLIGPSTFNFPDAARDAIAAGAARQCADAHDAVAHALALLEDVPARAAMSAAGKAFTAAHQGATARNLELIERFMSPPSRP